MMRKLALLLLAASIGTGAARAQLPDPTRPPGAELAAEAGGVVVPVESGVQTIIMRRDGKSVAVVNGRHVGVGDMLGEKRVVKISESEVVVMGESGREVLKATPAIGKVPATRPAGEKLRARRSTEGSVQK